MTANSRIHPQSHVWGTVREQAGAPLLFRKFRQLIAGRTAILISHRFTTVRLADKIYVLQEGRIQESGNHDEFIACGGIYARMLETQAQYYR